MNLLKSTLLFVAVLAVTSAADPTPPTPRAGELWAGVVSTAYAPGQTVQFRVQSPNAGVATWTVAEDQRAPSVIPILASGTVSLSGGNAQVVISTVALNHAGFLWLKVTQNGQSINAGAAVSPLAIAPVATAPADFDAFWASQRSALAAVAMAPVVQDRGNGLSKVTLNQLDGRKVSGWVKKPSGSGPFPIILELPAYGSGALSAPTGMNVAIYASITIHNADIESADPNAYLPNDPTNRSANYYRYAVAAGLRMIDYLVTLPEYNGARIILTGKSQGGGLSTMIAGLDSRVTHVAAVVPALSQHAGTRSGRSSGFPQYVWQKDKDGLISEGTALLAPTAYYDITYFAARFTGRVHYMAGWIDPVCPPSTVLAAYNQFPGIKELVHGIEQDHDWNRIGENWWPIWNANLLAMIALPYGSGGNTAPTISTITDQIVALNGSTGSLTFTVGDNQTAAGSLSVSASSSDTLFAPLANVVLGGSGAARTVIVTPAAGRTGSSLITLSVSDGSLSASRSFTVTVNSSMNTAPTISAIADQTVTAGSSTAVLAFSVADAQTASGALTLSAVSSNPTLVAVSAIVLGGSGANRTVVVTPTAGQSGTATVTLTVSDGALSATEPFAVTVQAGTGGGSTASVVVDLGEPTTTTSGNVNNLTGSRVGMTGSSITNLVASDGSASGVAIAVSDSFVWSYSQGVNAAGPFPATAQSDSFRIDASDPVGVVTLSNCDATKVYDLTLFASIVWAGNATTYTVNGTSVTLDPTNNSTRVATLVGVMPSAGRTIVIEVRAAPGSGSGLLGVLQFTARSTAGGGGNSAPTINAIANQAVTLGGTTGAVPITIGDAQTAAASLILSATTSNAALVPVSAIVFGGSGANRTVTVTPVSGQTGTATITVTVSDGLLTATQSFTVTVNAVTTGAAIIVDLGVPETTTPGNVNNITGPKVGITGSAIASMVASDGALTGISIAVTDSFVWSYNQGVNAAGPFPATAQSDMFRVDPAEDGLGVITIGNLNASKVYDLDLFASRLWGGSFNSVYTINGQSVVLDGYNNVSQVARFTGIAPINGAIAIEVRAAAGAAGGYLGAMKITSRSASAAAAPKAALFDTAAAPVTAIASSSSGGCGLGSGGFGVACLAGLALMQCLAGRRRLW